MKGRTLEPSGSGGKNQDCIHVATVADENYALALTVMLVSLLENNCSRPLKVFIMDAGIHPTSKAVLEASVAPFLGKAEGTLEWLSLSMTNLVELPRGVISSPACWARLLLPTLIPDQVERIIYIDSDTLILSDLAELYGRTLEPFCLWAAQDQNGWLGSKMFQIPGLERFGVPPNAPCFNAGVLLMDLKKWREQGLSDLVFAFAKKYPETLHLPDQTAINLALYKKIGLLSAEWNVQPVYRKIRNGEWADIPTLPPFCGAPKILHFVSGEKPWLPGCEIPWRFQYYQFWKKTRWPLPFTEGG